MAKDYAKQQYNHSTKRNKISRWILAGIGGIAILFSLMVVNDVYHHRPLLAFLPQSLLQRSHTVITTVANGKTNLLDVTEPTIHFTFYSALANAKVSDDDISSKNQAATMQVRLAKALPTPAPSALRVGTVGREQQTPAGLVDAYLSSAKPLSTAGQTTAERGAKVLLNHLVEADFTQTTAKQTTTTKQSNQPTAHAGFSQQDYQFIIRVGSFKDETVAKQILIHLLDKGFPASLLTIHQSTPFLVVVGPFRDKQLARDAKMHLQLSGFSGEITKRPASM